MNAVLTLAAKDLTLLVRDRFGLFWVFVFPLLLAVLFGAMFGGESGRPLQALPVAVADEDASELSRELLARLKTSEALEIKLMDRAAAREAVRLGACAAYIVVPSGFEMQAGLFGNETVVFEAGIDPSRHAEAGLLRGLLLEAVHALLARQLSDRAKLRASVEGAEMGVRFNEAVPQDERKKVEIFLGQLGTFLDEVDPAVFKQGAGTPPARVEEHPVLAAGVAGSPFEITFPSGMVWGLIGCVATFALSLARERTANTLLRLRFAPVGTARVLAGKSLACLAACLVTLCVLAAIGAAFFRVRVENPGALALAFFAAAACFAGLMAGIGTLGRTEQATAGAGWAILMVLAMFGGAMMPLYFMPAWMQAVSNVSPVKWAILAFEGALWRGFSMKELAAPLVGLLLVGAAGFAAGVARLSRERP
ncbi:MAG: ABC transporter permease [Planctomycetota bacterium]|nr:ABC transporter permease [Planctomycetota bacterium]